MTLKSRGGHLTHFLPILAWGTRLYLLSEENEWDRFQAREDQAYKVDQVPQRARGLSETFHSEPQDTPGSTHSYHLECRQLRFSTQILEATTQGKPNVKEKWLTETGIWRSSSKNTWFLSKHHTVNPNSKEAFPRHMDLLTVFCLPHSYKWTIKSQPITCKRYLTLKTGPKSREENCKEKKSLTTQM